MTNSTDRPARFVEIYTPSGLEGYFREIAGLVRSGHATRERLLSIQTSYGISPVPDVTPFGPSS